MSVDLWLDNRYVVDFEIAGAQFRHHMITFFNGSKEQWTPERVCEMTDIPVDRFRRFLVCDDRISFGEMDRIERVIFDREFRVCGTIDLLKTAYPPDTHPDHIGYQETIAEWKKQEDVHRPEG